MNETQTTDNLIVKKARITNIGTSEKKVIKMNDRKRDDIFYYVRERLRKIREENLIPVKEAVKADPQFTELIRLYHIANEANNSSKEITRAIQNTYGVMLNRQMGTGAQGYTISAPYPASNQDSLIYEALNTVEYRGNDEETIDEVVKQITQ